VASHRSSFSAVFFLCITIESALASDIFMPEGTGGCVPLVDAIPTLGAAVVVAAAAAAVSPFGALLASPRFFNPPSGAEVVLFIIMLPPLGLLLAISDIAVAAAARLAIGLLREKRTV